MPNRSFSFLLFLFSIAFFSALVSFAAESEHEWAHRYVPKDALCVIGVHPNQFIAHDLYEKYLTDIQEQPSKNLRQFLKDLNLTEKELGELEIMLCQNEFPKDSPDKIIQANTEVLFSMPNIVRVYEKLLPYAEQYQIELVKEEGKKGFRVHYDRKKEQEKKESLDKEKKMESKNSDKKTSDEKKIEKKDEEAAYQLDMEHVYFLFEFVGTDLLFVRVSDIRPPEWKEWEKDAGNPIMEYVKPERDILSVSFNASQFPKEHTDKNETAKDIAQYLKHVIFRFYQISPQNYMLSLDLRCYDSKSCKALKGLIGAILFFLPSCEEEKDSIADSDKGFAMTKPTFWHFIRALKESSGKDNILFQLKIHESLITRMTEESSRKMKKKQEEEQKQFLESLNKKENVSKEE